MDLRRGTAGQKQQRYHMTCKSKPKCWFSGSLHRSYLETLKVDVATRTKTKPDCGKATGCHESSIA